MDIEKITQCLEYETIKELRNKVNDLENLTKTSYAFYLKNSNLKDRL